MGATYSMAFFATDNVCFHYNAVVKSALVEGSLTFFTFHLKIVIQDYGKFQVLYFKGLTHTDVLLITVVPPCCYVNCKGG